nr:type II toxin-antitoxin system VapC family toxin [Microbacterium immunditiarum]
MADAMASANRRLMSAATYVEASVVIDARQNPVASRLFDELFDDIEIVPATAEQARIAREAYRDYGRGSGHPARLNFGDCFSYALATERREPLLYVGGDFAHTDIRSALDPARQAGATAKSSSPSQAAGT